MVPRRFPPPWTVHLSRESWEVQDATGFIITWFHFTPERRSFNMTGYRMTQDEARRLAVNFARLPELLGAWPPKPIMDDRHPAPRR